MCTESDLVFGVFIGSRGGNGKSTNRGNSVVEKQIVWGRGCVGHIVARWGGIQDGCE